MAYHTYFVPTHRELELENLYGFAEEVAFANRTYRIDLPLIILDDKEENLNKDKLLTLKKKYEQINIMHFNNQQIKEIYQEILQRLPDDMQAAFRKVYPNEEMNYGNTFNKIFIVASLLGSETIHRRDGDVLPQKVTLSKEEKEKYIFPIEIEMQYAGKDINGKTVFVVGSGYQGKWGLDVDFLLKEQDDTQLFKFFECLSIRPEVHQEVKDHELIGNNEPFQADQIDFETSSEPDCGNITYYKLFEFLPCSPAPFTLASDYFPVYVAKEVGLTIGYHNRTVLHKYSSCRYDSQDKTFTYWKGIAYLIDYQIYYRRFLQSFIHEMLHRENLNPGQFDREPAMINQKIGDYFRNYMATLPDVRAEREEKFRKYIEILRDNGNSSFRSIAEALPKMKDTIFQHTEQGIQDHIELISIWRNVIHAIEQLRSSKKLDPLVRDAKM